jgi:hypothetical protein
MKDDVYFLFDSLQEKSVRELKDLGELMDHPEADKNSITLRTFARACIDASKEGKKVENAIKEKIKILIPKDNRKYHYDVEKGLMAEEMKPSVHDKEFKTEKVSSFYRTKQGRLEVRKKEAKIEPVDIKKELGDSEQEKEFNLILDKRTNKRLVGARIENNNYVVIEPEMDNKDWILLSALIEKIKNDRKVISDAVKLDSLLKQLARKFNAEYNDNLFVKIRYYLIRDMEKLRNVEPLLHDHKITEINCEGYGVPVKVKREGKILDTNVVFMNKEELDGFVKHVGELFGHDESEFEAVVYEFMMHARLSEKSGFKMERMD